MSKQKETGTALSTEVLSAEEMMAAAGQMVSKATGAKIKSAYADLVIEQVVKIEDGQTITGIYRGLGPMIDVADPQDPSVQRPLQSYRIANEHNPKVVALVLHSAQLGRFLQSIPVGSRVAMTRLGQVAATGSRRVNQWLLGHTPPAAIDAIDTTAV